MCYVPITLRYVIYTDKWYVTKKIVNIIYCTYNLTIYIIYIYDIIMVLRRDRNNKKKK